MGADQPKWMTGIMEMTRTFGLELLESVLSKFPNVFHEHNQFRLLLKERVCSLVIKLFSPNVKHKNNPELKPSYGITSKLLRYIIKKFCESSATQRKNGPLTNFLKSVYFFHIQSKNK